MLRKSYGKKENRKSSEGRISENDRGWNRVEMQRRKIRLWSFSKNSTHFRKLIKEIDAEDETGVGNDYEKEMKRE